MAKIFGREYHEQSNSWHFRSSITEYAKDDIILRFNKDEQENNVLIFTPKEKNPFNKWKVTIVYDLKKRRIKSHKCSICGEDVCEHYMTILNYGYKYYSTDIFEKSTIQTFQTQMMAYNEFWQQVTMNAKIYVSDIFNATDKIRIYFHEYKPINIRLASLIVSDKELKDENPALVMDTEKQIAALSFEEIRLLQKLQLYKCSFSQNGSFFTAYKKDFIKILPILKNLENKVIIQETGDPIVFSQEEYSLNFRVSRIDDNYFNFRTINAEKISTSYGGHTTYIFEKNVVHSLQLPFLPEITEAILRKGYELTKPDLVYVNSVVIRQLSFIHCHVEFDEDVEIANVYSMSPQITFNLYKKDFGIHMDGSLDYEDDISIPMSVIRFPSELVRFDQDETETWFYVPPQVRYQILKFTESLPYSDLDTKDTEFHLVFEGEENIKNLKMCVYEKSSPDWNIVLLGDLKKEFIQRIKLNPEIITKQSEKINWFEYQVSYQYKDMKFSHAELKRFFNSDEKFMELQDGRLVYFANQIAYDQIEEVLDKSKNTKDENVYEMNMYNVPYIYQLKSVNDGINIKGDAFIGKMFNDILHRKTDGIELSEHFSSIMRSYQKSGFQWLKMLSKYSLNGILADDMGLGKTIQSIAILSDLPKNSISLVVSPKTLIFNWAAEIDKFAPHLTHVNYEGSIQERHKLLDDLNINVIIASYAIIQNDLEKLREIEFDYLIIDEAQHIKNASALRSKAIKKVNSKNRLALTGTPMENSPTELWSIFDFLMPGYLPKLRQFKKEILGVTGSQRLRSLIAPFILRRTKANVLVELPDKQIQTVYCKMNTIQEKMYMNIVDSIKKDIAVDEEEEKKDISYMNVLAALTKLRQICNHPSLVDDDIKQDIDLSGKIEAFHEIVKDAVENGKKILVFSQFVGMLKLLQKVLEDLEIKFEYMDGSTKKRQKHINNFNENSSVRVFLISLKTGGFGLNLTAADTVILADPWWNPMGENQAIDRAHRIGQTKKVMVYKLITKGSVEEKILDLQETKIALFENIIEGGQNILKSLDINDIKKLFDYK